MNTEKQKAETIMDIVNEKVSKAAEIRANIDKIPENMREGILRGAEALERDAVRLQAARNAEFLCVRDHDAKDASTPTAGNAAKQREALDELVANIEMRASVFGIFSIIDRKTFLDAKAALSAPARNCDRFGNELDAQIAFLNEVWLVSVDKQTLLERDKFENWTDEMKSRYAHWLLATAKEGGAK